MSSVYKKYAKTITLTWAGCFALFLLIYIFVMAPLAEAKKQIGQQLVDKKKTYEETLSMDNTEAKARLKNEMKQWGDKLKDFAVKPEDLASLTFDIGQIANDIKLDSFSIKPQDSRSNQNASSYQYICENGMSVSFKADFNKFATFLNAMERHRPVIFVEKFKIYHAEQSSSAYQVNMELAVFVKKPQGN